MSDLLVLHAAALMRQRAGAATPGPWEVTSDPLGLHVENGDGRGRIVSGRGDRPGPDRPNLVHVASWHPAVAVAVADWLAGQAGVTHRKSSYAVAVARAYLTVGDTWPG